MKKPVVLLAWLSVPLAAAAGYFGGRAGMATAAGGTPGAQTVATAGNANNPLSSSAVANWSGRLEKCSAAELPAMFAEINGIKDASAKSRALRLLCARWAEVDAAGGVAFFTKVKEDTGDPWGRIFILTEWALRDTLAAYEATMLLGKDADGELTNVGTELLREDPERFWLWFQKSRRPLPYATDPAWNAVIGAHFDELAAIVAELAAAEGKDETRGFSSPKLSGLYKMLAANLATRDVAKAIEWAKAAPELLRNVALLGALGVVAEQQPEKIAEYLPLLKNRQVGSNFFQGSGAEAILKTAVEKMTARDPLAALEWIGSHQGQFGDYSHEGYRPVSLALSEAMRDGKLTPEEAFNAVRAIKKHPDSVRSNVLRGMWGQLSAEQLAGAAEWIKGVDSKESRPATLEGILLAWQRKDSDAAIAFANSLHEPAVVKEMYDSMARSAQMGLVSTQGERAAAAIARIPPEYRADILYNQVRMFYAEHMADHSPPFEGASFAAALADLPASAAKDKAVAMVIGTWGGADPLAAIEWAGAQTDAGVQEKATGAAVEAWAKEDAWGASEWIKSQPQGTLRDTAAHHLARELRTTEPDSAWAWAADIQDPATRLEAQSAVLRKWRDSSASDARAAVEAVSASLTPEARQTLVDALEKRDARK